MKYLSTRNKNSSVSGAEAVVKGIAADGGLFVPEYFPQITLPDLNTMVSQTYPERAAFILSKFFDEFTYAELLEFAEAAYRKFDDDSVCPLVIIEDGPAILELTHGPTLAFKDMALSLMPYLLSASRKKLNENEKTLILVATSGDTGKAALEGFKDAEGIEIIVFYPESGVSAMQKLQMTTAEGKNLAAAGIFGNFDDAQTAVKAIFADKEINARLLETGYKLSSANSINWGRLAPQIAYYFSAYADLLGAGEIAPGEKINFAVPTGNFGNILACYYARRMGLPVANIICASNQNRVLADFFENGEYDVNRDFFKTMSPAMDILVSSNLERMLFELTGRDDQKIKGYAASLASEGSYVVDTAIFNNLDFVAGWADEEDTRALIEGFFEETEYVLDPHTAVAASVYYDYAEASGDDAKTVIVSTANPYKFPSDVYFCLTGTRIEDEFKAAQRLQIFSGMDIPDSIKELKTKAVLHKNKYEPDRLGEAVFELLEKINEKSGSKAE
jgi:threonine synthase